MKCTFTADARAFTITALALLTAAALSSCTPGDESAPTSSLSGISAIAPPPARTSTVIVTSIPLTGETTSSATTVDTAPYAVSGQPGSYRWSYARDPLRECVLQPAGSGLPQRITCAAPYPEDAPSIRIGAFDGPPNAITLTAQGTEPTITEGGPTPAPALTAGHRLTFGDLSCTALPGDAITCTSPDGWFTVANGVLTTS